MKLINLLSNTVEIKMDGPFGIFLTYIYIFIIGSFCGWILEILYRRFFSMKKWINPGFLKGPCIPLYGFGLCALHLISELCFKYLTKEGSYPSIYGLHFGSVEQTLGNLDFIYVSLIAIAIIGVAMTLIEFIGGIIFVKGLNIRLWDYSKLKGNVMGIICPQFSFLWLVAGTAYWFGLRPFINYTVEFLNNHAWVMTFFIGAYVAILLVDFINSVILSIKLSKQGKLYNAYINYEQFKLNRKEISVSKNKETAFTNQIKSALTPIKNKLGVVNKAIVSKMYIDGVVPEIPSDSETPRMKESRTQEANNINKEN